MELPVSFAVVHTIKLLLMFELEYELHQNVVPPGAPFTNMV